MRRSKQAKQQTHARIVAAAARRFRAEGIRGVGIDELMGEVGLTHGGFYAHFGNKEALVAEACSQGLAQSREALIHAIRKAPKSQRLAKFIDLYLSDGHRDHPEGGCAIPALASEVARSSSAVRSAFTGAYNDYHDALVMLLREVSSAGESAGSAGSDEADEAMVLLAGLAGTMLLARAVDDPVLSERVLRVNRDFYKRIFSPASPTDEHAWQQPQH